MCEERWRTSGKPDAGMGDYRTPFESDYGRVLFSSAIRRMHDKTQVIPLTNGDSVLTRLTHSIQVMNLAESLINNYCRSEEFKRQYTGEEGYALAANLVAIVRAAAFVHDVGNPPFGHFGETIIQDYFREKRELLKSQFLKEEDSTAEVDRKILDFTEFDGNAQGLRILTKLQYMGNLDGLNLTYATLAAYMKYPNPGVVDKSYIGTKKHGVFCSEESIFKKIVDECKLREASRRIRRHPLSFIVEAADSIAYLVMDIEDGYNLGWYDFETLIKEIDSYLPQSIEKIVGFSRKTLEGGEKGSKKLIVDFRVKLIQYLVNKARCNFEENLKGIDEGTYGKELIEDDENGVAFALQRFSMAYIISHQSINRVEMSGHSVLNGLLDVLSFYAFHKDEKYRRKLKSILSSSRIALAMHENMGNEGKYQNYDRNEICDCDLGDFGYYARWRIIVDFISGMTDKYAVELYQQLSGQTI